MKKKLVIGLISVMAMIAVLAGVTVRLPAASANSAPANAAAATKTITCQGVTVPHGSDKGYLGHTICSKNFYFHGVCNGQDQNPSLNDGKGIDTPLVTPWEPVSISIVDVQIAFIPGSTPPTFYSFAGNSYEPDIMSWDTSNAVQQTPAGYNFQFPAAGGKNPPHIDLHVSCAAANFPYQGFYTVYYFPNAS